MPPAGLCAMKAGCRYGYSVTTRARAKGNLRARSATKNSRPSRAAIRRITRVRCSVPSRIYLRPTYPYRPIPAVPLQGILVRRTSVGGYSATRVYTWQSVQRKININTYV